MLQCRLSTQHKDDTLSFWNKFPAPREMLLPQLFTKFSRPASWILHVFSSSTSYGRPPHVKGGNRLAWHSEMMDGLGSRLDDWITKGIEVPQEGTSPYQSRQSVSPVVLFLQRHVSTWFLNICENVMKWNVLNIRFHWCARNWFAVSPGLYPKLLCLLLAADSPPQLFRPCFGDDVTYGTDDACSKVGHPRTWYGSWVLDHRSTCKWNRADTYITWI